MSVSAKDILNNVAETLVAKQRFPTIEEALWGLALSTLRDKIGFYQRRIRRFERKYSTDFETFSDSLKDRATPAEEDDRMKGVDGSPLIEFFKN